MTVVYSTYQGKVFEHVLIKETPKGFRVECSFIKKGKVLLSTEYHSNWLRFGGKSERIDVTSLNKDVVDNHAKLQRAEIRERVKLYSEHWLSIAGEK